MPRTTENTTANQRQFVMITIEELQTLTRLNASARTIETLIALRSFAWNGKTCFPSLKAIAERMGLTSKTYEQTVLRALKWLEDHNLIKRNHRTSKERFVINPTPENLADPLCEKPSEPSESANGSRHKDLNRLNTPISPKGTQKKRRFNKWEKRQRKWERKAAAGRAEVLERQAAEDERQSKAQAEWLEEHRKAQDQIISLNGTSEVSEQVSLVMARMDYESRSDLWLYEPAPINELGLDYTLIAYQLRKTSALRNPYFDIFCFGTSLQGIQDWFRGKIQP